MIVRNSLSHLLRAGLVLAAIALTSSLLADVPADAVLQGFEPNGDFLLEIDGTTATDAEMFYADKAQAYLILSRTLGSPVVVTLRGGSVEQVHLMKVARRDNGTVDILADADLRSMGRYSVDGTAVAFTIDGKAVKLKQKPDIVGEHTLTSLIETNPGYGRSASAYSPDDNALNALRSDAKDVRVRVYFGSWCSVCKRHLPSMLKVQEVLGSDAAIAFEYVGLAKPGGDAPPWPKGIVGVPTAVVFVGEKEVGRLTAEQWRAPEIALQRLVAGP